MITQQTGAFSPTAAVLDARQDRQKNVGQKNEGRWEDFYANCASARVEATPS
jgi:hypothetical protein